MSTQRKIKYHPDIDIRKDTIILQSAYIQLLKQIMGQLKPQEKYLHNLIKFQNVLLNQKKSLEEIINLEGKSQNKFQKEIDKLHNSLLKQKKYYDNYAATLSKSIEAAISLKSILATLVKLKDVPQRHKKYLGHVEEWENIYEKLRKQLDELAKLNKISPAKINDSDKTKLFTGESAIKELEKISNALQQQKKFNEDYVSELMKVQKLLQPAAEYLNQMKKTDLQSSNNFLGNLKK